MTLPAAILVLGARVNPGGRPSAALSRRLDAAAESARLWPDALVVACGGRGWDGCIECDVMARELEARGVAADRIMRERLSLTTLENLREGGRMVAARVASRELAVVTCDWHLPRAIAIARAMGLDALGVGAPSGRAPVRLRLVRAIQERIMVRLDVRLAERRR